MTKMQFHIHTTMIWLADNFRYLSSLLPDQLEFMLLIGLAIYFAYFAAQQA